MKSDKTFFTLFSTIIVIEVFILFALYFQNIASFFFNPENSTNGELLKVFLTAIGGVAIFLSLWFNNKRIQELTKQNEISDKSNTDSRFNDAIGHLGSDNQSTILGGIYTLYQIAKSEYKKGDDNYRTVIVGLYCSYIKEKAALLYNNEELKFGSIEFNDNSHKVPITIKTILELLFDDKILSNCEKDLSGIVFKNILFQNEVKNCDFSDSTFEDCIFYESILNCSFVNSQFIDCNIGITYKDVKIESVVNIKRCIFNNSTFSNTVFNCSLFKDVFFTYANFSSVDMSVSVLDNTKLNDIKGELNLYNVESISETEIDDSKVKYTNCFIFKN